MIYYFKFSSKNRQFTRFDGSYAKITTNQEMQSYQVILMYNDKTLIVRYDHQSEEWYEI